MNREVQILKRLLEESKEGTISINILYRIIMQEGTIIHNDTVKKVIKAFELMGYLKLQQSGDFTLDPKVIQSRINQKDVIG